VVIELQGGTLSKGLIETGHSSEKKRIKHKNGSRMAMQRVPDKTIEIDVAQDTTALRSRKGDTGSVLWHARYDSFMNDP
jgi:hypothetical protein